MEFFKYYPRFEWVKIYKKRKQTYATVLPADMCNILNVYYLYQTVIL